jgi:hypothetical protein
MAAIVPTSKSIIFFYYKSIIHIQGVFEVEAFLVI